MNSMSRVGLVILTVLCLRCTESSRPDEQAPPPTGPPIVCTEILMAGITVEVRDALTGEPAAYEAHGEIRDGAYVEDLQVDLTQDPQQALRLTGAWERPGTYSVVVRKEGYRDWTATATVEADACHVHTVVLQAMLESQG